MSRPRISVVVPVYNAEPFIGETIESVLAQTRDDWELIVADNASTDGTIKVVRRYDDRRVRLLTSPANLGAEANFNRAVGAAQGEFVKVLPADDTLLPRCLEHQGALLEDPANRNVVMTCCARVVTDEGGRALMVRGPRRSGRFTGAAGVRRSVRSGTNLFGEPGAVLFRASVLSAVGGFDGRLPYVIDLDMWCRMLLHGDLHLSAEPLCTFRLSTGSQSSTLWGNHGRQFRTFIRKLRREPRHGLRGVDIELGALRSFLNEIGRMVVYRLVQMRGALPPLWHSLGWHPRVEQG